MPSGKGDADFEGDADGEDSDDDINLFEEKRYTKTQAKNWTMHENGQPGRVIHPIPFTGPAELFRPNLTDDELKGLIDVQRDIRFSKSLSGCYRRLMVCLFMIFYRQGCATLCCTTSKLKGGCQSTIGRKRLFLLMTLRTFLDANWSGV